MAYTKQEKEDFRQKEARELFCKAVNSMIMGNDYCKKGDYSAIDGIIEQAKKIVNTAFQEYVPVVEEGGDTAKFDFPKDAKPK